MLAREELQHYIRSTQADPLQVTYEGVRVKTRAHGPKEGHGSQSEGAVSHDMPGSSTRMALALVGLAFGLLFKVLVSLQGTLKSIRSRR